MSGRMFTNSVAAGSAPSFSGRTDIVYVWITVIALSLFAGLVHVYSGGNFMLALVLLGAFGVVLLSLMRPLISFYLLLALALMIEQYPPPDGWTAAFPYHSNFAAIHPSLSGIPVCPLEIHLVCIIAGTFLQGLITRQRTRPAIAWLPMLVYLGSIIFGLIHGLSRGGSFAPALWEVRGIFYLLALAMILPQIIQTDRQIKTTVWIIIGALAFRAAEVNTFYVAAGFSLGVSDGYGNHEDAGFLAGMFIFLLAMVLLKTYPPQRRTLLILFIPFVVAFIASGRRTVYGVIGAALITLVLMLEKDLQRRFLKVAWIFVAAFALYLVVFWTSNTRFAIPAQSIRMAFADDPETAGERYSSNLYREAENYNLIKMIQKSPLTGSGYGVTVDYSSMPMPLFWELGFFIPHNQLLGIAAKTGAVGFVLFWFFYLSLLSEVARGFKEAASPYHKAVIALVAAAIVNHLVYSYFDIMLTYYRNNVLLGTLLGLASVIIRLTRESRIAPSVTGPPADAGT